MTLSPRPLPSGSPPPGLGPPTPDDDAFRQAMRGWRQNKPPADRAKLWARMNGFADRGASPFASDLARPAVLYEAVSSGSLEALELAVRAAGDGFAARVDEADLDQNPHTSAGHTVLAAAWLGAHALGGSAAPMMARLIELGAHPDGCAIAPGTPLRVAVGMGDERAAHTLIRLGADPLRLDADGATLLHYALRRGSPASRMWSLLIEAGLPMDALDGLGRTPFDTADPVQAPWIQAWRERAELDVCVEEGAGARREMRI